MANARLQEIRQLRLTKRQKLIDAGVSPYPAEARRTHTTAELLASFEQLQTDKQGVLIVGRVLAMRQHGAVSFIDVSDAYDKVQVQLSRENLGDDYDKSAMIDVGDFVQISGRAITTKRGMQTLLADSWHWLAKNIRPLPDKRHGLKDPEKRYRRRALDLLQNEGSRRPIVIKSEAIDWLRKYLKEAGFLEVETPILQPQAGGAAAQPFVTHHNSLNTDLYLRIAPELYLKRLLVGGLERVFEIGRNFRNEGMDREHNPEFTMAEFYWAYADYEDLMDFTEQMLSELVKGIIGDFSLPHGNTTLEFTTPWRRVKYFELMQENFGVDVLTEKEPRVYEAIFKERKLELPKVRTFNKLVDELYKEVIRPTLVQPTLLYDYPIELAPLAKTKAQDPRIAEVMQLVVSGMELVKAYSELNDPVEQRTRFVKQQENREQGDLEAAEIDEDYLLTMEYGMPPAGGWGMGIDRLVTLLANVPSIRDTITFPLLKPKQ
jgi:lysyl-tRNA synthetase class 2